MPNIILKAREIMEDPGSSLKDLAGVIEHDQAIVARVLALANSAYYGLSGLVSSIQHASILLGQKTLGELITIAASSKLLSKQLKGYMLHPGDLWKHSLAAALGSKMIAEKINAECIEDAFIAGLNANLPVVYGLPLVSLLLVYVDQVEQAVETYTVASNYPLVAHSRWFADVAGQRIAALAAELRPDVVAAARERGRAKDLWVTAEELVAELRG